MTYLKQTEFENKDLRTDRPTDGQTLYRDARTHPSIEWHLILPAGVNKASVNIAFLFSGSVIFILCWAPYYCYSIYRDFFPDHWKGNKDRINIFIIIEVGLVP